MTSNNTSSSISLNSEPAIDRSIYVPLKAGDPCPYCGQILMECQSCDGGKAEFFVVNMGCMDCQGGYGVTCPEPPQDDHELWKEQYCARHGCKSWREST